MVNTYCRLEFIVPLKPEGCPFLFHFMLGHSQIRLKDSIMHTLPKSHLFTAVLAGAAVNTCTHQQWGDNKLARGYKGLLPGPFDASSTVNEKRATKSELACSSIILRFANNCVLVSITESFVWCGTDWNDVCAIFRCVGCHDQLPNATKITSLQILPSGSKVAINCTFLGDSSDIVIDSIIQWYHNKSILPDNEKFNTNEPPTKLAECTFFQQLIITGATVDESGNYTCKAETTSSPLVNGTSQTTILGTL